MSQKNIKEECVYGLFISETSCFSPILQFRIQVGVCLVPVFYCIAFYYILIFLKMYMGEGMLNVQNTSYKKSKGRRNIVDLKQQQQQKTDL